MFSEKAPYIVTLVVAGLAWTLTHIVDRLLATPMLTYHFQELTDGAKKSVYVTLENIGRDKVYRDVRITLTAAQGDSLSNPVIIPVEPASEGDEPGERAGRTFDFKSPEIQPGGKFEISTSYSAANRPTLRIAMQSGSIYALQPSVETYLVKHEMGILAVLMFAWLIALAGVGIWRFRTPGGGDGNEDPYRGGIIRVELVRSSGAAGKRHS